MSLSLPPMSAMRRTLDATNDGEMRIQRPVNNCSLFLMRQGCLLPVAVIERYFTYATWLKAENCAITLLPLHVKI